jgi:hypothetical protein
MREWGVGGDEGAEGKNNPNPQPLKGRYFVFGHFLTISADA